jgi:hypothetical protein
MMDYEWNFIFFNTIREYILLASSARNILFAAVVSTKYCGYRILFCTVLYNDRSLVAMQFVTFIIQTILGIQLQYLV